MIKKTYMIPVDDLEAIVTRKNIKTLRLSVHSPNGEVRISVPNGVSDDFIVGFVESKMEWIRLQREKLSKTKIDRPKEYLAGENHYFLGREYPLQVRTTSGRQMVEMEEDTLILLVREGHTREKREKLLNEWYRDQLKALIPEYIEKWEKIMEVEVEAFGVKNMKTRWGTCNIRDRRIWINLKLAKRDESLLEYIIVHEMTHLLERLHNDRFKILMTSFIPNWRGLKNKLNNQK